MLSHDSSWRAQRSNPEVSCAALDCFAALAMTRRGRRRWRYCRNRSRPTIIRITWFVPSRIE
ncbi:hypothetical protein DM480_08860 [Sphingomonas sp. FARSPH]|nr:hypothetical protein DM480_08860 [Sphingomonas sp. FARSPH]